MAVLDYSNGYEPARYKGRNADWYAVAQRLKAAFVPGSLLTPRQILIHSEGLDIVLTDRSDESQSGVLARTVFYHSQRLWLTLHLYPRRMDRLMDRILSWPGCPPTHRVRIDDPAFDRHGFLRCPDRRMAARLFGDDSFRSMVLNQAPGWLRISPRKRDPRTSEILLYRYAAWTDDEDLVDAHNITVTTIKGLTAIGWAETDEPNSLRR